MCINPYEKDINTIEVFRSSSKAGRIMIHKVQICIM